MLPGWSAPVRGHPAVDRALPAPGAARLALPLRQGGRRLGALLRRAVRAPLRRRRAPRAASHGDRGLRSLPDPDLVFLAGVIAAVIAFGLSPVSWMGNRAGPRGRHPCRPAKAGVGPRARVGGQEDAESLGANASGGDRGGALQEDHVRRAVVLPLAEDQRRALRIRCVVRPTGAQAALLSRLGHTLPDRLHRGPRRSGMWCRLSRLSARQSECDLVELRNLG